MGKSELEVGMGKDKLKVEFKKIEKEKRYFKTDYHLLKV